MGLAWLGLAGWEFVDLIFGGGVLWGCVFGDLAGNGGVFGFGFPGRDFEQKEEKEITKEGIELRDILLWEPLVVLLL